MKGKVLLSKGTNHSKGTAILLKKYLNYNLINIHSSEDGRIVLINIKVEDKELTLMNLYAPNHLCERKHFFS